MAVQMFTTSRNRSTFYATRPTRPCSFFLISSYRFSIMFTSGLCAGQLMVLVPFLWIKSWVERARCTGALSSWKMYCWLGNCWAITGHKLSFSICWYFSALILPLTALIVPTPCQEIHLQTITSEGGFLWRASTKSGLQPSPCFLQMYTRESCPTTISDSSEKIPFSCSC